MFLGLSIVTLVIIGVVLIGIITLLYQSLVNVGGTEQAILERRWFGKSMPHDRVGKDKEIIAQYD